MVRCDIDSNLSLNKQFNNFLHVGVPLEGQFSIGRDQSNVVPDARLEVFRDLKLTSLDSGFAS